MQPTNLTPAPIGGADIAGTWLEEMYGDVLHTPQSKNGYNQFLIYVEGALIRCSYTTNDNRVLYEVVPNHLDEDKEILRALAYDAFENLKNEIATAEEDGTIAIRYNQQGFHIEFFFYYILQ